MLHAPEFRLGNLFMADDHLKALKAICIDDVAQSDNYQIGYLHNDELVYESSKSNSLQPVLLTDDLIKACGFQYDSYFQLWQKKKVVLGTGMEMELSPDFTALDFAHKPILKDIKYLHQLQNLFYALKKVELSIENVLLKRSQLKDSVIV